MDNQIYFLIHEMRMGFITPDYQNVIIPKKDIPIVILYEFPITVESFVNYMDITHGKNYNNKDSAFDTLTTLSTAYIFECHNAIYTQRRKELFESLYREKLVNGWMAMELSYLNKFWISDLDKKELERDQ